MTNSCSLDYCIMNRQLRLLLIRVHKPGEGGRMINELAEKLGLALDAT